MEAQNHKQVFSDPESWKAILIPHKNILLQTAKKYGIDPQKNSLFYVFKNAIKQNSFNEESFWVDLEQLKLLRFLYLHESGAVLKGKFGQKSTLELSQNNLFRIKNDLLRRIIKRYRGFKVDQDLEPQDKYINFMNEYADPDTDLEIFNYEFIEKLNELKNTDNFEEAKKLFPSNEGIYKVFHANKAGINELIKNEILGLEYQKKKKDYGKPFLSRLICDIVQKAKELEIFDKSLKTISTSEACFLYDSIIILGFINGDEFANNQDKYQWIKAEMKKIKNA